MCMFQYRNKVSNTALVKGVEYFECGACPECLQKKSRKWALRCGMQAKVSPGVMVTLTYDSYKYENGLPTNEENPTDPTIPLSKKHCQDFIKRLRKWLSKRSDKKLYYLLTAERGKRTNRAHYHALLFNVKFDDIIKYKKSSRGNIIYKSQTLERLWSHGICTVDCINLSAKTARYCTKYCAKDSGIDDTFMLFSHGIGEEELLKRFDGKSYWIDGREYSIPREIWQKYIETKYNLYGFSKYVGKVHLEEIEKQLYNKTVKIEKTEKITLLYLFDLNYRKLKHLKKQRKFRKLSTKQKWLDRLFWLEERIMRHETILALCDKELRSTWQDKLEKLENSPICKETQDINREIYTEYRDNDPLYQEYLAYWKNKNEVNNYNRPAEIDRIALLPNKKYWSYKQKALLAKARQEIRRAFVPPRSKCHGFDPFAPKKEYEEKSFAPLSRHYTANDTLRNKYFAELRRLRRVKWRIMQENAKKCEFNPFVI